MLISAIYVISVIVTTELYFYPGKFLVSDKLVILQKFVIVLLGGFSLGASLGIAFVLSRVREDLRDIIGRYNQYLQLDGVEKLSVSEARELFVELMEFFWEETGIYPLIEATLPEIFRVLIFIKFAFFIVSFFLSGTEVYLNIVVSSIRGGAIIWILAFLIYPYDVH